MKTFDPDIFDTSDTRKYRHHDIAICNTVFCGEAALKLQNVLPTILYIREAENIPDILRDNNMDESCIRNAENIVCISEYAARFIEKIYSPKNIRILHNFLISPFFGTASQNKVCNKVHFLIAATIEPRKGIEVATEAFKLLPRDLQEQAVLDIYTTDKTVAIYCNMGTNGIDGCTSTFMGQCSVVKDRLCFLIVGDLSFFYDMNSIWNKKLSNNIRILMVNNNGSGLLRGHKLEAITSVHNTSAKGWVESTGFKYISASSKEEYEEKLKYFLSAESEAPLFLKCSVCKRMVK